MKKNKNKKDKSPLHGYTKVYASGVLYGMQLAKSQIIKIRKEFDKMATNSSLTSMAHKSIAATAILYEIDALIKKYRGDP